LSSNPVKVLESTVRALTPGGRVVLVEYGGDDLNVPISRRTDDQRQIRLEAGDRALTWERTAGPTLATSGDFSQAA